MAGAWLRILGLGDASGLYLFHTGATVPTGAPSHGTALPYLLTVPTAFGQRIKPLDILAGDAAVSVDLLFSPVGAATVPAEIVRGSSEPAEVGGQAVRVSGYHSPTATTINVTDSSGFSPGDLLWLPSTGEALTINTIPTGTTIDVTGGRGSLGTRARPIPGGGLLAPPVFGAYPGAIGAFAEVGFDGQTLFRGVVNAVAVDGQRVSITIESLTSTLRRTLWAPPGAIDPVAHGRLTLNPATGRLLNTEITTSGGFIEVDADAFGDTGDARWTHALLQSGSSEAWAVVEVTYSATVTEFGRSIARYTTTIEDDGGGVLAIGDGQRIVEFTDDIDRLRAIRDTLRGGCTVSWTYVDATSPDLAGIVADIATRVEPVNTGLGLPSGWVDTSRIGDGTQIGSVPALAENTADPDTGDPAFVLPPQDPRRKIVDILADHLLRPAFIGCSASRSGALAFVDWSWDSVTATALTGDDTATNTYQWATDAQNATPLILLRRSADVRSPDFRAVTLDTGIGSDTRTVRSGTVTTQDYSLIAASTFGGSINVEPLAIDVYVDQRGFAEREDRARAIVEDYARPLPTLGIVTRGTSLSVGDRVTVSRSDLPKRDGTRGASTIAGIVLEQSSDPSTGTQALAILVFGWFGGDYASGAWAPAAEVTAWSAPTATVQANAFAASSAPTGSGYPTSDADAFGAVIAGAGGAVVVDICDADGNRRGTARCTAAGTNTLTLTSTTTTPANGDLIVLASPGEQLSSSVKDWMLANLALLGDTSGQISGDDVARWY
jgi:hypothetical protein